MPNLPSQTINLFEYVKLLNQMRPKFSDLSLLVQNCILKIGNNEHEQQVTNYLQCVSTVYSVQK